MAALILVLYVVFGLLALVVLPTCLFLCWECLAAYTFRTKPLPSSDRRASLAVLIPAHNEEAGIGRTVASILPQLNSADRLIVIADNCSDNTAQAARQAGADVLERHDLQHRGKGFALAHGVNHLRETPPELVVFVDADTPIEPDTVNALAQGIERSGRPQQAIYLLNPPDAPSGRDLISAFAFRVRNLVRPLGQSVMGVPCAMMGTGMALPWEPLSKLKLASGNLVEDMQLGIDLVLMGYSPEFNPHARVNGVFPSAAVPAADAQRRRWEHGHLLTILRQTPRVLWAAVTQGRPSLCGYALMLSIPPLALLVCLLAVLLVASVLLAALTSAWWPLAVAAVPAAALGVGIFLAWLRFATDIPGSTILVVPFYVLRKLPMYFAFLWNRQQVWVRTER